VAPVSVLASSKEAPATVGAPAPVPALRWSVGIAPLLWYVTLIGLVLTAIVGLLRLIGEEWYWTAHYHKIVNPLLVLLAWGLLLARERIRVDALMAVSLLGIVTATLVGVGADGEPRYFVSHLFVGLFALSLYGAARNTAWPSDWLEEFTRRASAVLLLTYLVILSVFWAVVLSGRQLYFGVGTGDLTLAVAYYLVRRRWVAAGLGIVLIAASGKRGSYLGLLTLVCFWLPIPGKRRLALRGLVVLALVLLVVAGSFLAEPYLQRLDLPFGVRAVMDKWFLLNPFVSGFDIGRASGGRSAEIAYAVRELGRDATAWLTGLGYGWSYAYVITMGQQTSGTERSHYLHLSPLNYVLLYGIPLSLALFVATWRVLARVYRWVAVQRGRRSVEYAWVLATIGSLAIGLTGYSYGTDASLWLGLGMLASLSSPARAADGADAAAR